MESELNHIEKLMTIKKKYSKFMNKKKLLPSFAIFAKALENRDFNSQQELTDYLDCNKAHTSRTLLKMQLEGLIKPVFKKISLTEKGKQYLEKVNDANKEFEIVLFKDVSVNDIKVLEKVVDQFFNNIKSFDE